jgi:hypothetical protein
MAAASDAVVVGGLVSLFLSSVLVIFVCLIFVDLMFVFCLGLV